MNTAAKSSSGYGGRYAKDEKSITGAYLSGRKFIPVPEVRRKGNGKWLTVRGAAVNNLKHTDFSIPLGTLTCVDRRVRLGQVVLCL